MDPDCIDRLHDAFTEQVWPDEITKSLSWESSDDVTAETEDWVDAIIQLENPVFDEYENIPDLAGLEVQSAIVAEIQSADGWSLADIRDRLAPKFDLAMADQQIDTIARTETAATLNRASFAAIEARKNPDEISVEWVGPHDGNQTELCNDLSAATDGGVPFPEFKELAREYAESYPAGKTDWIDEGILHYQERYTIERV